MKRTQDIHFHGGIDIFNNKLTAIGGDLGRTVEQYNETNWKYVTNVGNLSGSFIYFSTLVVPGLTELLYIFGKFTRYLMSCNMFELGGFNVVEQRYLDEVWQFNSVTWTKEAPLQFPRILHKSAIIGSQIIHIGGIRIGRNAYS